MHENLKITAHFECGVVSDGFLPIDSILRYQVMRERYGHQDMTVPGMEARGGPHDDPIPVKKTGNADGTLWFYRASFAVWPEFTEGQDHWAKRFDSKLVDLLEQTKGRLNTASGRYRGYHMPVFYRSCPSVAWHAVGDRAEIARLLATVTHIGKKTAHGWGSVRQWTVEPHSEDWSLFREGKPMRAIPHPEGILYGIRPSYWNALNQTKCVLPGGVYDGPIPPAWTSGGADHRRRLARAKR